MNKASLYLVKLRTNYFHSDILEHWESGLNRLKITNTIITK